jgi:hypothetical protein
MFTVELGSLNPSAPFALIVKASSTIVVGADADINGYWDSGERFDSIDDARDFYNAECDESLNWVLVDEDAYNHLYNTCGIEA